MKDGAPGREIGKGKYNYLIGVYYPNEKTSSFGGKGKNRSIDLDHGESRGTRCHNARRGRPVPNSGP